MGQLMVRIGLMCLRRTPSTIVHFITCKLPHVLVLSMMPTENSCEVINHNKNYCWFKYFHFLFFEIDKMRGVTKIRIYQQISKAFVLESIIMS